MKKEHAEQWAEALLSGKYGQCKRQMRDNQGNYCCLGVATDIFAPDKADWEDKDIQTANTLVNLGIFNSANPEVWRGIHNFDNRRFSNLNDTENMSFDDIGTFILFSIESGDYKSF